MILGVAAILYRQHTFYRSPLTESSNEKIQALLEDSGREVRETEGVFHSIPLEQIVTGNPDPEGIPPINEPRYESVFAADQYLDDAGLGLLVEVDGEHRYYPYQILVWHEVVNDVFNGENLLVTYNPLTNSGKVFDRTFGDDAVNFSVSGKLWNSNSLLSDQKSGSLWSQLLGEAVVGELTGSTLHLYPSLTISWSVFKTYYPYGEVLSRSTGYDRDYTQDPYEQDSYYESAAILFPLSNEDERLHAKTVVFGYHTTGAQTVYRMDEVEQLHVVNDEVGEDSLLVIWDEELETVRGFSRQVGQDVLSFSQGDPFFIDDQTGSLWNQEGECVGGEYLGAELDVLPLENAFWFSWAASYPETTIYNH